MGEKFKTATKTPETKSANAVSRKPETALSPSVNSPVDQMLSLQRTIGNQAVQRLFKSGAIQAKLKIGQPGDIYEQEADRVAEQVMRMPEPSIQRQPVEEEEEKTIQAKFEDRFSVQRQEEPEEEEEEIRPKPLSGQITPLVRRQVEEEKEEEETIQTKAMTGCQQGVAPIDIESRINSLKDTGQSLPESVRAYFEPRFRHDFSQVRVHTGARAAELARGVNAKAFTTGKNVVFGVGHYSPGTSSGMRLLAHELTHTLQQGFRKPHPTALSTRTFPTKAGQFGLLSHTLARQIQRWEDVYPGGIRSYSTWSGAKGAIRRLQPKHPRLKYRIIRRGRNFVIQSQTAGAGSRSSSTTRQRPPFNPPKGRWVLVSLQRRGRGAGGTGWVRLYNGSRLTHRFSASGGQTGHTTPIGRFEIKDRDEDHRSNRYGRCFPRQRQPGRPVGPGRRVGPVKPGRECKAGERFVGADMAFYQRFAPQVGFHRGNPRKVSHGCIHLQNADARALWGQTRKGTKVIVCGGKNCQWYINGILGARAAARKAAAEKAAAEKAKER